MVFFPCVLRFQTGALSCLGRLGQNMLLNAASPPHVPSAELQAVSPTVMYCIDFAVGNRCIAMKEMERVGPWLVRHP